MVNVTRLTDDSAMAEVLAVYGPFTPSDVSKLLRNAADRLDREQLRIAPNPGLLLPRRSNGGG